MMGALGDFDSGIYRVGYDRYFAMLMFLLATFIICVVFMNMLIAIMGDTFARRNEVIEQVRIKDHLSFVIDNWYLKGISLGDVNQVNYIITAFHSKDDNEMDLET